MNIIFEYIIFELLCYPTYWKIYSGKNMKYCCYW